MNEMVYYDQITQSLSKAVSWGGANLTSVPGLLKLVLEQEMWRKRVIVATGEVVEFKRFEEYVVTNPLEGLGANMALLRRMCENEPDVLDLMDRAVQNPPDVHVGGGYIVTATEKRPEGNSSAKALRRLRKDRPDLHKRVLNKELSPNAAMIEAGFRPKTARIRLGDIASIAKTLHGHLLPEEIKELIDLLQVKS